MSATGALVTLGTLAALYGLLALALNIKFGETGILDFGHAAYYLIGAYLAVLVVIAPPGSFDLQEFLIGFNMQQVFIDLTGVTLFGGLGWVMAITVAIIAAGFVGLVVALPAIRLRADYLAIALLGVGVIAFRVAQSEKWLFNGPDNLRGYDRPFNDLLPLPGDTASADVLLGLVIMLVWLMILVMLVRVDLLDEFDDRKGRLIDRLLWVLSLGGGYWAVRRIRKRRHDTPNRERPSTAVEYRPLYGVTALYGLIAAVLSFVGFGSEAILLFFGFGSLLVWAVFGLKVREHYVGYTRRSALAGLAMALGLIIAITPTRQLVDFDGSIAYVGAFVSMGLLAVYGYAIYWGYYHWDRFDIPGNYLGIIGIGLLWLLGIRYFIVPVLNSATIASMIQSTQENIFWLIDFGIEPLDAEIDYRRFLLFLITAATMASYFMLESLRTSPYGRVMRAIRDDENVAMSLGKNTFYFKVQAMVIGGGFAGLAGALGAVHHRSIGYTHFHPELTFFIFLAVILGGKANNKGVILGAAFYWLLVRGTSELADMFPGILGSRIIILNNAIIGLMLVLVLYYKPAGIWAEQRTIQGVEQ